MVDTKKKTTTKSGTFSKQGLKQNSEFNTIDRDILNIVLNDDEKYTVAQAKQLIKKFKEGI